MKTFFEVPMPYFIFKTVITAIVIVLVSELSKRFSFLASLLAALPLTSILIFIWMYVEQKDVNKIAIMSEEIFYLVIPSLAFFLILPILLKKMNFYSALAINMALTFGIYFVYLKVLRIIKPDIQL
jgi:uncharacterized membrane protein (GlpM family)